MTLIQGGKKSAQNTGSRCASCGKSVPEPEGMVDLLLRVMGKADQEKDYPGECGECGGLLCYECEKLGCPCSRKDMQIIRHAATIAVV